MSVASVAVTVTVAITVLAVFVRVAMLLDGLVNDAMRVTGGRDRNQWSTITRERGPQHERTSGQRHGKKSGPSSDDNKKPLLPHFVVIHTRRVVTAHISGVVTAKPVPG